MRFQSQEHYYDDNIKRKIILKELKGFKKSTTFSFEKVLLKFPQSFDVVFPYLPVILIEILVTST